MKKNTRCFAKMFAHCTVGRAQLPEASRPYAAVGRKALMYVYCKFFRLQRKREDFQSSSSSLFSPCFASRRFSSRAKHFRNAEKATKEGSKTSASVLR